MQEVIAESEDPSRVVETTVTSWIWTAPRGRHHVLEAVFQPLHRLPQPDAERDQHVFGVHDQLGAEAAADVRRDDADSCGASPSTWLMNWRIWCGTCDDAHTSAGRPVVGDPPARLHRLAAAARRQEPLAHARGAEASAASTSPVRTAAAATFGDVVVHAPPPSAGVRSCTAGSGSYSTSTRSRASSAV